MGLLPRRRRAGSTRADPPVVMRTSTFAYFLPRDCQLVRLAVPVNGLWRHSGTDLRAVDILRSRRDLSPEAAARGMAQGSGHGGLTAEHLDESASSGRAPAEFDGLKTAEINGTSLAYREQGAGEPVIFVHGDLSDLRTWKELLDGVGRAYRAIAYSRCSSPLPKSDPPLLTLHIRVAVLEPSWTGDITRLPTRANQW